MKIESSKKTTVSLKIDLRSDEAQRLARYFDAAMVMIPFKSGFPHVGFEEACTLTKELYNVLDAPGWEPPPPKSGKKS